MPYIVLGIDGLEYNLAKKWGMKGLLQKYYGKHDVSVIKPLYTPILWSAILVGVDPREHGFSIHDIDRKRAVYGYHPVLRYSYLLLRKITKRKTGLRSLLAKLGLFSYNRIKKGVSDIERMPTELRNLSVIEVLKSRGYKVWVKEFPSYNDEVFSRARLTTIGLTKEKIWKNRFKRIEVYRQYTLRFFQEMIENLDSYDVFFYYTPLIDMAEHVFSRSFDLWGKTRLYRYYREVEQLVVKINSKYPTLIVSDHGFDFKKHTHSDYGFWSVNYTPPFTPKTIFDFKNLILSSVEALNV